MSLRRTILKGACRNFSSGSCLRCSSSVASASSSRINEVAERILPSRPVRSYHHSPVLRVAAQLTASSSGPQLASLNTGESVTLSGWLIQIRPVSKFLAFAVLLLPRGKGQIQLIIRSEDESVVAQVTDSWQKAGLHGAVQVTGSLALRPESAQKHQDAYSRHELQVERCTVLNATSCEGLPFNPTDVARSTREEVRLRNRHLDLRNTQRGERIRLRSRVTWAIRSFLHDNQFDEIETPILLRSTPEGAREYLVPTRLPTTKPSTEDAASSAPHTQQQRPKFFALQQSPQQPKQLLVISGVTDRYFQIARCFRDEDGRKDRQPEFTQVDMEISFVSGRADPHNVQWTVGGHEIKQQVEGLLRSVWSSAGLSNEMQSEPFRIMTYEEAMTRYGSDKPDLRYDIEIVQLGQHVLKYREEAQDSTSIADQEIDLLYFTLPDEGLTKKEVEYIVSQCTAAKTEVFWGQTGSTNEMTKLLLRKSACLRSFLSSQDIQASDVSAEQLNSVLANAARRGLPTQAGTAYKAGERSCVVLAQRLARSQGGSTALGDVRRALAQELMRRGLFKPTVPFYFAWIIEFPLFTRVDEDKNVLSKGRWNSSHHPFTSPKAEDIQQITDILAAPGRRTEEQEVFLANVKGQHYDLVLNGMEIGGGSVRIHEAQLQRLILSNVLELNDEELSRFNHLLRALQHGAPPHAGIALGLDRLMAILCNAPTIRDVIAFPKSAQGTDLLFGSPDTIDKPDEQSTTTTDELLERYGLRTV